MTCTIDGCDNPRKNGVQLCSMHQRRKERHGSPYITLRKGRTGCEIPDCRRDHRAKGLCNLHYNRLARAGDLGAAVISRASTGNGIEHNDRCMADDCDVEPAGGGKWCYRHWRTLVVDVEGSRKRIYCGTQEGRDRHGRKGEPMCVRCERVDKAWFEILAGAA